MNSQPTLSKYRAVLRFAFELGLKGRELVDELRRKKLEGYYEDAVSHFRYDPLDRYVEDDDDRFLRSLRHLNRKEGLPTIEYSNALPKPTSVGGFATALVRVRKGSMQLIGFADVSGESEKTMRLKVASLVPEEAVRQRKKLSDKKLYWLYVTCDLYSRFLPKLADQLAWARAAKAAQVPSLAIGSSENELEAYIAAQSQKGKKREADAKELLASLQSKDTQGARSKKFALLDALQFKRNDETWMAETLTTHPNTPCVEVVVPSTASTPVPTDAFALRGLDAARTVEEFPRYDDWDFRFENGIGKLQNSNGRSASATLQDLHDLATWRSVDQNLSSIARFRLSREDLHELEHWRTDYANAPRLVRKAFQSIVRLIIDSDGLKLVQPMDQDYHRLLGRLISDEVPVIGSERFFDFKFCEKLAQLALDYGITYEFELMEGHEGSSALRLYPVDFPVSASITLPLMLSNKGNPAEITAKRT